LDIASTPFFDVREQVDPFNEKIDHLEAAVKATKMIIQNQEKEIRHLNTNLKATNVELKKLRSDLDKKREVPIGYREAILVFFLLEFVR